MDIRKYFGGGGPSGSKPASQTSEGAEPPSKKTKKEEDDGSTHPAPAPPAVATKSSPPAKSPAKRTPKSTGKRAASKTATPASKRKKPAPRKKKNQESDGDEELSDLLDSDFEIELDGGSDSDDGDDSNADNDDVPRNLLKEEGLATEEEDGAAAPPALAKKKTKTPTKPASNSKLEAAAAGSAEKKEDSKPSPKKPKATRSSAELKGPLAALADNPAALAAVAAVDAAAATLPPESELGMTLLSEAAFGGRAPDEPPLRGGKETPNGHPDCLTGKTFVISGVLDSLTRQEAEDLIKRHGGKVTSAVSGRTSFVVVGQHTGRTKYQTAKTKGIPMINEDGLFTLIKAAPAPEEAAEPEAVIDLTGSGSEPNAAGVGVSGAGGVKPSGFYGAGAGAGAGASTAGPSAPSAAPARVSSGSHGTQLWVEKWRPKTSAELIGNQTTVATLRQWLRDWEGVHLHGKEPTVPAGARRDRAAEMKKKAVIMSGSPGVGKTSSALIICRELGYEAVEVNASDTRSKADASVLKGVGGKMANAIKELSTNNAVSYDSSGRRKKLCLIMDEVDGMSAGDRGGVADLIKTIAKSKVPIIAICNDKYSPKLRSLRNHCLELDFRKPTVQQISKRMLEIAAREGLSVNQATMDALVQTANGGDIRLILGQLQMIRLRATSLKYDDVRKGSASGGKDLEMSPFEAARRLLDPDASSSLTLADQLELVFQDADLVPLLVQENYLNHRPRIANTEASRLAVLAKAAEGFSAGDVANRAVRQYQNWSLMPFAAAMGTVNPAAYSRGMRETFGLYPNEPNFPRFTAWLGQNSSYGKQRRLLGELHTRMLSSGAIECDRTALRLSYLPMLRASLVRPLVQSGKEGIPEVLKQMGDYCLAREDVDYILDVTKFKTKASWGEDPYKSVETATKSAFTRAFNQQHIKPKTGFGMEEGKKKGKGRGKGAAAADEDEEEEAALRGEGGEGEKNGEEEEEELDPVMLRQKLMGMKHKGMELTLKDGSKASKPARGGRGGARGARGGRGKK